MKISYSNYPVLKYLAHGKLDRMRFYEFDSEFMNKVKVVSILLPTFEKNVNAFKSEINVISYPFYDACYKCLDKLFDLYKDIKTNDMADLAIKGTFIMGDYVGMINYKKDTESEIIIFYLFEKDGTFLAFYNVDSDGNGIVLMSQCLFTKETPSEEIVSQWIKNFSFQILALGMFKSYAEVETKFLKPNERIKEMNCKYVNDTQMNITYLDSKWFTNLVRSEGFKVGGHFRWQRCGEGFKEKKLIWISEFEKTGYTSKARVRAA